MMHDNQNIGSNPRKRDKAAASRKRRRAIIAGAFLSAILLFVLRYTDYDAVYKDFSRILPAASLRRLSVDVDAFLQAPPAFAGDPTITVNGNVPFFSVEELQTVRSVSLSEMDELGRCGAAIAYLGPEKLPSEKRSPIGMITPSGWHTVRYDDLIEDKYLYNRCHLIGYQLSGENADSRNLITGTRYMNMSGMLPYENAVYAYIASTGNHVLYRVTPVFTEKNLLASGVLMEAYSVEDHGGGLCFCIYAYNVQPGILIDYLTGESRADDPAAEQEATLYIEMLTISDTESAADPILRTSPLEEITYIVNTNTKRFHDPSCPSVQETKEKNKVYFYGTREEAIEQRFIPCGRCKP